MPLALGLENVSALDALGLHLAPHGFDEIGGRHDVLDLDAVDFQSPRRHRGIDHAQQSLVDLVAMRQHLVEVHRAHHRADVGHGQHDDRLVEIGDLVAGFRSIKHLIEGDAVHRHGGVVLGDHLLLGNADHLLHHVHLAADAVEIGNDDVQPRRQRAGVFAESLDGPVVALRHRLDAGKQRKDHQQHKRNGENVETGHERISPAATIP